MRFLATVTALCGVASAHFQVLYPTALKTTEADEGTGPCGGATIDLTKDLVDFHVDGEAIALKLTHPQGKWLFRVTTDPAAKTGWEEIAPIVQQSGLGNYCNKQVKVPSKYVGKAGIVSVVSKAVDGMLYQVRTNNFQRNCETRLTWPQCIAANFVKGSQDPPSLCTNTSSAQFAFDSDSDLTALVGNQTTGSTGSSTSATTSSPAKTSSPSAAAGLKVPMIGSTMGSAFAATFFVVVGAMML